MQPMNFNQGCLPSCQTLAAITALWINPLGRQLLEKMVSNNGDTYEVSFPLLPHQTIVVQPEEYRTTEGAHRANKFSRRAVDVMNKEFPVGQYSWVVFQDRQPHVSGDLLMRVFEVAYANYQKITQPDLYANVPEDAPLLVYRSRNFHYLADRSLHDFSGWDVETLAAAGDPANGSHSFAEQFSQNDGLSQSLHEKLKCIANHRDDYVATVCTVGTSRSKTFLDPGGKIIPWHDHAIASVNLAEQTINLIDPYNSRITMILQLEDFFSYFYLIAIAEARM